MLSEQVFIQHASFYADNDKKKGLFSSPVELHHTLDLKTIRVTHEKYVERLVVVSNL